MLAELTNTSGVILNALDTYETGGSGPAAGSATGGARKYPLPHPFAHLGEVAVAAVHSNIPVHMEDFRHRFHPWGAMEPRTELNQMIQAGMITVTFAVDSGSRDIEDAANVVL